MAALDIRPFLSQLFNTAPQPNGAGNPGVTPGWQATAGVPSWVGQDVLPAMSDLGGWIARGGRDAPAAPAGTGMDWTFSTPQTGASPLGMGGINVANILGAETLGMNPNARNPNSSAAGLGQFLEGTWNDKDLKQRAGYGSVPDAQWKKLRVGQVGVAAQVAMTQAYAQRNAEQWTAKYGQPPSPGQSYGMHFLDSGGFMKLVDEAAKDPSADAASMFPGAAAANAAVFYHDPDKRAKPLTTGELVSSLTRRGGDISPFTYPALQGIDPGAAMAMMPVPGKPTLLPERKAPQMGELPPRPQEEPIDTEGLMARLQAFAPKAFDEKAANEGRIGAVLAGIARGAASTDAHQGAAAMLAAMGAGGSAVEADWEQHLKADKKTAEEATRLFELGVAKEGINWDLANRETRVRNLTNKWQDQRDTVLNSYTNAKSQFDTDTQTLLHNNGLENEYNHLLFDAKVARARVGLQATEFNTGIANQQLTGQTELDLKRFLFADEKTAKALDDAGMRNVMQMAGQVGLNPKIALENKDHNALNALQGLAYMQAGNKQGAVAALANEMVANPDIDAHGQPFYSQLAPTVSKQIMMVAKQNKELAAARVAEALNQAEADPKTRGHVLQVARAMAGRGLPLASAFMHFAKPSVPVPSPTAPAQPQLVTGR